MEDIVQIGDEIFYKDQIAIITDPDLIDNDNALEVTTLKYIKALEKQVQARQAKLEELEQNLAKIYRYSVFRLENHDDRNILKKILLNSISENKYNSILKTLGE